MSRVRPLEGLRMEIRSLEMDTLYNMTTIVILIMLLSIAWDALNGGKK